MQGRKARGIGPNVVPMVPGLRPRRGRFVWVRFMKKLEVVVNDDASVNQSNVFVSAPLC